MPMPGDGYAMAMPLSIHSKSKPSKFIFTAKYHINQNILAHCIVNTIVCLLSITSMMQIGIISINNCQTLRIPHLPTPFLFLCFPSIPQDTDVIKCDSSNRHPCYKCQGVPLHLHLLARLLVSLFMIRPYLTPVFTNSICYVRRGCRYNLSHNILHTSTTFF